MANQKLLNKLWFAYISALIMWTALTYSNLVQAYVFNQSFAYVQESPEHPDDPFVYTADFLLYYNDAVMSWECARGNKIDVWDPQLQNSYLQKLVPHVELKKIFYSQYPPYLMVLCMPLSLVSLDAAYLIWEFLGLAGIILSVRSLLSTTLKGKFERAFTYIGVLSTFPAWLCFRLGQIGLAIFPALMWYWDALDRKNWFRAGMLGGFCLLKLQYAPILFITGCFLGGLRFFAGYSLMGLIYLIGCVAVLGLDNVLHYPEALKMGEISGGQITGVSPESQQNLRGQLVILTGNDGGVVHLVVVAVWAVATLYTAFLWWKYRAKAALQNDDDRRRMFMILASITMLLQLVTSPHTHKQDYIFVTLPAIWLIYNVVGNYPIGEAAMPGVRNKNLILAIRYLLLGFPILSWFFFTAPHVSGLIQQKIGLHIPALPIQPFFLYAVALIVLLGLIIRDTASNTDVKTAA